MTTADIMTTPATTPTTTSATPLILDKLPKSPGVWAQAWARLKTDRVGMACLYVTVFLPTRPNCASNTRPIKNTVT